MDPATSSDAPLKPPPPLPILTSNQMQPFPDQKPSALGMGSLGSMGSLSGMEQGNNDALIEQLAQRQQTFSQLGNFMTAIQNEAQSVELWRTKLKELETLKAERQSLKEELNRVQEQSAKATQSISSLSSQLSQLKNELALAHVQIKSESNGRIQAENESNRLVLLVAQLEESSQKGELEAKAAATLLETNTELNTELGSMKKILDKTNADASRAIGEAEARLEVSEKEKQELKRHFSNVLEDVQSMKEALVSSQQQCSDLETRLASQLTLHKEKESSFEAFEISTATRVQQTLDRYNDANEAKHRAEDTLRQFSNLGVDSVDQLSALHSNLATLESKCAAFQQDVSQEQDRNNQTQLALAQTKSMYATSNEELNLLKEDFKTVNSELQRRREAAAATRDELEAALTECDGLRDQCDSLNDSLLQHAQKLARVQSEKETIQAQLEASKHATLTAESKIDEIEQEMRRVVVEEQQSMMQTISAMKSAQTDEQKNYFELMEKEKQQSQLVATLSSELEKRCDELSQCNHKIELKNKELENMKESIVESEKLLVGKERHMAQSYSKEKERLKNEYESALNKINILETNKRESLHELSSLKSALETSKQSDVDNKHVIKQLEKKITSVQKAADLAKAERADVLKELKELTVEGNVKEAETEQELSRLKESNNMLELEIKSCRKNNINQLSSLQEQIDIYNKEINELKNSSECLSQEKMKAEVEVKELIDINDQLEASLSKAQKQISETSESLKENENDLTLRLKQSDQNLKEMTNQFKEVSKQKHEISLSARELNSALRVMESKTVEIEGQLSRSDTKLANSEKMISEYAARCEELETEINASRQESIMHRDRYVDLEHKNKNDISKYRKIAEEFKDKLHSTEEECDSLKEQKETFLNKLNAIDSSTNSSVIRLENELKSLESSHRKERERMNGDAEAWRKQMAVLEEEMESAASKSRATITASRDEVERQRRAAFDALNECNELKLAMESHRRDKDALKVELDGMKDALSDAEKRIASQKEAIRTATREAEAARVERDAASEAARHAEEERNSAATSRYSGNPTLVGTLGLGGNDHHMSFIPYSSSSSTITSTTTKLKNPYTKHDQQQPSCDHQDEARYKSSDILTHDTTTSRDTQGVGLGLSVVDDEIASHMAARQRQRQAMDSDSDDDDGPSGGVPSYSGVGRNFQEHSFGDQGTKQQFSNRATEASQLTVNCDPDLTIGNTAVTSLSSINATADFLARRNRKKSLDENNLCSEIEVDQEDEEDGGDNDVNNHGDDDNNSNDDDEYSTRIYSMQNSFEVLSFIYFSIYSLAYFIIFFFCDFTREFILLSLPLASCFYFRAFFSKNQYTFYCCLVFPNCTLVVCLLRKSTQIPLRRFQLRMKESAIVLIPTLNHTHVRKR